MEIQEKFLYEIWKDHKFNSNLSTKNGEFIEVIDSGIENKDSGGPDFKNARIKIGNITFLGDVEIDNSQSDWKFHGHYFNKKYNKVILHIFFDGDDGKSFVLTQDGRKVQSVSLEKFLEKDLRSTLHKAINQERKNRKFLMPCSDSNKEINDKVKLDFIYELGLERFKKKCNSLYSRLKEITYLNELNIKEPVVRYELDEKFYNRKFSYKDFNDNKLWQQLFYESVFEALGYSKNKDIMRKLAETADIKFLKKINSNSVSYIESALFSISGLIPEPYELPDEETAEYVRELIQLWSQTKNYYDGKILNSEQWHFFKLRPQNFPTVRIAGGARILYRLLNNDMIGNMINKSESIYDFKKIIEMLRNQIIVRGEGYWHKHFVFNQPAKKDIKYFIGLSRADEIIINIVFPFLTIYFEIYGKEKQKQKIVKLYSNFYQDSDNHLVSEVTSNLRINDAWKRSILYQGTLELYRNYCTKNRCLQCKIGEEVFS